MESTVRHIFDSFFYSAEFSILICGDCGHGVDPSYQRNHLRLHHRLEYKHDLDGTVRRFASLKLLSPRSVPRPMPFKHFFEQLPEHRGFSACAICLFANRNRKNIRQHLNAQHNLKLATRDTRSKELILENVSVQTFFREKTVLWYFITNRNQRLRQTLPQSTRDALNIEPDSEV